MTWKQVSARQDREGLSVLLDGGLVTVRSLGPEIATGTQMRIPGKGGGAHQLSYRTPWGHLGGTSVRSGHLTAVIVGSGTMDHKEGK